MRMVFDHERDHPSPWATVVSIAEKIGCVSQTLPKWVRKAKIAKGRRGGVSGKAA